MKLFKNHGTKLIGSATAIIGTLSAVDPLLLQAMLGAKGVGYLTAAAGILTILRGVQNSKPPQ